MTTRPSRRRRTTHLALLATVLAIVLTVSLAVGGGLALYHSTEGSRGGSDVPELAFPATPTALLAGVDDTGALASLTVLVARPDGAGGSVVPIPVSADASGGQGEERTPVDETFELIGTESLRGEVEALLGITLDAVEIADEDRLAQLLEPIGTVEVELAEDVSGDDGEVVAAGGSSSMTPQELAAVLTARDPSVPALDRFPAAAAAWQGIERAVDEGLEPPPGASSGTVAGVLNEVLTGPVRTWRVRTSTVEPEINRRDVDVSELDRSELLLVFGQIAPGRVAAPNPALSFRVVVPFTDEQLGGLGWSNADVAYQAIATIQFLRGNVLSVDTTPAGADERTRVELADDAVVVRGAEQMFGDVELVAADERIVGVDAVVVLGTAYLDQLAADGALQDMTFASIPAAGVDPAGVDPATTPATTTPTATDG